MCADFCAQALFSAAVVCAAPAPILGYDPATRTTATQQRLHAKEIGYRIECPDGTESCLRRAEAICQGGYTLIGPRRKVPPIQVYLDGKIQTLNAGNPYIVHMVCNRAADMEIVAK
jgi:hypothetical protein